MFLKKEDSHFHIKQSSKVTKKTKIRIGGDSMIYLIFTKKGTDIEQLQREAPNFDLILLIIEISSPHISN